MKSIVVGGRRTSLYNLHWLITDPSRFVDRFAPFLVPPFFRLKLARDRASPRRGKNRSEEGSFRPSIVKLRVCQRVRFDKCFLSETKVF